MECSQVVVEREAGVVVCVNGHFGEEGRSGEELDLDAIVRNHIAGSREVRRGQDRGHDGERKTAHCARAFKWLAQSQGRASCSWRWVGLG